MDTLEIYLKSGHTIVVTCESWNFKWNSSTGEYVSYTLNGVKKPKRVDLVPRQIAGFIVK